MRPRDDQALDDLRLELVNASFLLGDGLLEHDIEAVHQRAERVRALVDGIVAEVARRPQTGPTETR